MAAFSVDNFFLSSSWKGYFVAGVVEYTTPSSSSASKTFDISSIPAGAVIDSASLTATLGSPYTGAAYKRVDGASFNGSMDVLNKLQGLNGAYANGVSFEFQFKANGGQGSASGTGVNHSASLSFSNVTMTVAYHMPTSGLTLSPGVSVDAGTQFTALIQANSPAYSHRVTYQLGSHSAFVDVAAGVASTPVTFAPAWVDVIPNSTAGTATVTLHTYNGGTLMGTDVKTITVTVPASSVPAIGSVTPALLNEGVAAGWNVYVKTKSRVRLSIAASGIFGSTITSASVSGDASGSAALEGGVWVFTSGYLNKAGTNRFTVTVYDSRGRSAVNSAASVEVMDYSPPSILTPSIFRSLQNGDASDIGTIIRLLGTFSFSSLGGRNALTAKASYRQMPSGGWSSEESIANGVPLITGSNGISTNVSWQAKIALTDSFSAVTTFVESIGTSGALFDVMPNRFAVGKMAERNGLDMPDTWECYYKGSTLDERFVKKAGDTLTGTLYRNCPAGSFVTILKGLIADNDYYRIATGGTSNGGYLEIATADDANEPIYIRQYIGDFTSIARTLTLLDGNGHTITPGNIVAGGILYENGGVPLGNRYSTKKVIDYGIDMNTVLEGGMWRILSGNPNIPAYVEWGNMLVVHSTPDNDTTGQLAMPYSNGRLCYRGGWNFSTNWSRWYKVYTDDTITKGTSAPSGGSDGDIYIKYI